MKKICVYSGSKAGFGSDYREAAIQLGNIFVEKKIELVYGGSRVGLMGEIASRILEKQGSVTGIMPKGLFPKEIINRNLTCFIEVQDMHERKKNMADLADGFIALPGGLGTFEELFEMLSWTQLGIHKKPIGILNVANFFDPLLSLLQNMIQEGFMNASNRKLLLVSSNPAELLDKMEHYTYPTLDTKWTIEEENTGISWE